MSSETITVQVVPGNDSVGVTVGSESITVVGSASVGPQGIPGPGVPAGGTTGQILAKASDTDFDTVWIDPA